MDYKIEYFEKHNDSRGQLVVFLKRRDLSDRFREFGQIYFVTFDRKGVVRGNHYHKRLREWFGVVHGKLEVALCDVTTGKKETFVLDGDSEKYVRLEIGPNIAHAFTCRSSGAALLNYTDVEWDAGDSHKYILTEKK